MPETQAAKPTTLTLPQSMKVKDLERTHKDYRADLLTKHQDLYEGGERFERNKDRYLRKRALDQDTEYRKSRVACAHYTPHSAGAIDWLCAAAFQAEPALLAKGDGAQAEYWHGLNADADGTGRDLAAIARSRLLELMLHQRSYFAIVFPKTKESSDRAQQRAAGGLSGRLCELDAKDVDDWEHDESGNLVWIRIHTVEQIRANPFGPMDSEKHTWTFVTKELSKKYTASRKLEQNGTPAAWKVDQLAAGESDEPHQMGELPIVAIEVPNGLWVMQRLAATALAIFNREASLEFALDTSAYALPVIRSKRPIKGMVASELGALRIDPEDSAGFLESSGKHFEVLASRVEVLKADLFLAIQAMALQAAAKDDNGRQSGVAKFRDFGAITTLLSAFAAAMRDALEKAIAKIKKVRDEEKVEVTLQGLDKFDVQSLELKLKLADSFLKIPGIPDAARKWVVTSCSLAMAADAPPATREEIRVEAEKSAVEKAEPPAEPGAGPPQPVRSPKTEEVKPVEKQ